MLDPIISHSVKSRSRRWLVPWLLAGGFALSPAVASLHGGLFPSAGYAFRHTQPSSAQPIAYNPCRPIEYVVYDVPAPAGAEGLLAQAIEEVSAASGLQFAYVGPADNPSAWNASTSDVHRKPVLIGWATEADVDQLQGRVAGVGGSSSWAWDAERGVFEYVTGIVVLDADALEEVLARPDGRDQARAIVMHELGHLVGLAHVDDPDQLMYDENTGRTELGAGDREGLAILGGRCVVVAGDGATG